MVFVHYTCFAVAPQPTDVAYAAAADAAALSMDLTKHYKMWHK